jgi:hypothetical protein
MFAIIISGVVGIVIGILGTLGYLKILSSVIE